MDGPVGIGDLHAVELPWRDPDDVLWAWRDEPWLACLDSGGPAGPRARWTILCRRPRQVLEWRDGGAPLASDPLAALRALLPPAGSPPVTASGEALPFAGGVIGFAGYGVGRRLEGIATRHVADPAQPDLAAGFYDHAVLFDRVRRRAYLATIRPDPDRLIADVSAAWAAMEPAPAPAALPRLAFAADQAPGQYAAAVARAVERIAAGDIFQVNITGRMAARRPPGLTDGAIYRALRRASPAPFGAWLACGPGFGLLSASPERFVHLGPDGVARTRPIKGTRPRGATPAQDAARRVELAADEKERAENLMIVDLMRNDLGRVARIGSVGVPELLSVETFTHVHHLVSEVTATLAPGRDAIDLLRATLPPGSVTGAPKHRAMQIIDELESSARQAYCGVVFRIGTDGAMDSSVVIRALATTPDAIVAAAGGGITILSDPGREYAEMCLKIAPLLALFGAEPAGMAS
ncbi:Chorismate binding-like protein [Gluconacetobacter diazotrophicus PA1 5]|uniref:Anthranilate synthase component I family protein n=2 Tax=Gluconacetobacter diazotrophicus TaxID=33996 RepID=A0A7W4FCP0_GLUDI|nr:anthranilate synthase component I family protein [Gluconacetobacter diazotrophicus]ACI51658.1 Chorismate binding-like protein [Gluconacetobacter diazotrophicus PA1 5]MBB2155310.1 anthranilate synthase component I family protein [Gluconacetobacter diazotrophicus]TWB11002.1 para-aminobenzoate synthetase component 1 [Gluconacetobacter diazotrophicus]CAP55128.1 putative Para-aminobenzoate synthase [Gluconacetobacter diazotrophicus PA1 5]